MRFLLILSLLVSGLTIPTVASADSTDTSSATQRRVKRGKRFRRPRPVRHKKKRKRRRRVKKDVTIPVDVGLGPATQMVTGPIQDDQQLHYGLKISLAAIIDKQTIRRFRHKIPKKYQRLAKGVNEIRLRPGPMVLIPDTIFISPKVNQVAMWGANWRLIGLGIPLIRKPRLALSSGLNFTYAYFSPIGEAADPTHFVRPGLDVKADFEIPITKAFLIGFGWSSFFYPPQQIGGNVFEWGEREKSIWHIGQAFFQLHFRIPYTTKF